AAVGARDAAEDRAVRLHPVSARLRLRRLQSDRRRGRRGHHCRRLTRGRSDRRPRGAPSPPPPGRRPPPPPAPQPPPPPPPPTTPTSSLGGPRAGLVLCRKEHAAVVDQSVFPGLQGGPHMNVVAAIAVTLKKAAEPAFRSYAAQVLRNARALADTLLDRGCTLVTGGTDNHMLVLDTVASADLDRRTAERRLHAVAITTNKQIIPDDPKPPLRPSGVRLGSPAATTRGMREPEMRQLGEWIADTLRDGSDDATLAR